MNISTEQKQKLIDESKKALENVYPKNSTATYSAAVLTKKGNIYSSSNYGSDTASLTLHAEHAALAHAAAHGEGDIVAVAVSSKEDLKKGEFTTSCHMCKQLLWESRLRSKLPMLVIFANQYGETQEVDLDDMMPYPWPPKK